MKLYAIKDTQKDKLITGITNPSHKFWERKQICATALNNHLENLYSRDWQKYSYAVQNYKIIEFELKEVVNEENT